MSESIDISNMDSIREYMYLYEEVFDTSTASMSEKTALDIIKDNLIQVVSETFDYRSPEYDDKVESLYSPLENLPRCIFTEPLYTLSEKAQSLLSNNKPLIISQECKMDSSYPIDFVLCRMYSEGYVSNRDMDNYKASLESEVYSLVNNIFKKNDIREDSDNRVPNKPQELLSEVIHPNFQVIENMYNQYRQYIDQYDSMSQYYSCSPTIILDKIELCNVTTDQFVGYGEMIPTEYALCTKASLILQWVGSNLEEFIVQNQIAKLYIFTRRLVDSLKTYPSITSSVITKLALCCIIDLEAIHLRNAQNSCKAMLNQLIKSVDDFSVSICDKSRNGYGCLLNFLELFNRIEPECNVSDGDWANYELQHSNHACNYTYETDELASYPSICDGSLESYISSMNGLTEMFQIASDGTIKVSIKEKTTYMNEYAVNHRLLKYNASMRDYEAMKYNLIYHMILIESIEKNVIYNNKVKKDSELYKDAEQARRYAKSDIATYLPKLKQADKSFDINQFYKQVKAEQATITIQGAETASGIKTILKHILY